MRYHLTPTRMARIKKQNKPQKMTSVGEDVVVEACALLVGMEMVQPPGKIIRHFLQRLNTGLP